MSTRLLGRPTGASPSVSAWHSSFPRAWSPNEARWEPPRGVIPELLLDRTALRGRQPLASEFDKTLIARGRANSMAGRGSLRGGNEAQGAATVSALATVTRTIQPCNADSSRGRSRLRLILAHLLLGRPFRLGRRLCRSRRLVLPARGQALFEFAHGLTERA